MGTLVRRPKKRGFAAMSATRRRKMAQAGARALHAAGLAHQFTPEEAREARAKQRREEAPAGTQE